MSALTLMLLLALILVAVLFLGALGYLAYRHPRTVPAMGATLVACIATITAR
ncbi:hypothetical protein [Streptomyces sp. NPDC051577]|uniref:hypothetical protein n=1 Tax=Streptomyces sp. NPDC051577 TaxID=3155166 RepID=UPI0034140E8D